MTPSWFENAAMDAKLVQRPQSFLAEDLGEKAGALQDAIKGSKCLMIGAAGSIGSSTLRTVARFNPAAVHVVDHDENGLAELVRSIRSAHDDFQIDDFQLMPLDYGGRPFFGWLGSNAQEYDYIFNFAALKHVRSEKDPYSILAMLETNVLKMLNLAGHYQAKKPPKRVFSVSTDKAANPSSMMGATKRIMEHALFGSSSGWSDQTCVTSARFANVARSNGSLLRSWQHRFEQRQPMACPQGCRRYFVSIDEAGHLCTLAGVLGERNGIIVPQLDPEEHLVLLEDVIVDFLSVLGFKPHFTQDEQEALTSVEKLAADGKWPVLLTPLDTSGEKPYEEFVGTSETLRHTEFKALDMVEYLPMNAPEDFPKFVDFIQEALARDGTHNPVSILEIKQAIGALEAEFMRTHVISAKSLDQRI